MDQVILTPGAVPLKTWREIWRGAPAKLDASAAAREASAHLLLMCREIAPGVPTPVAISVHTPVEVTPAVGTAPEAVMRAFTASLPHTAECDLETATRTDAAGSAREHDDAVG